MTEPSTDSVERELVEFLEARTKASVTAEQDLFAAGLVSSMFAMELVVHLEQAYQVAIVGPDLKLANFRTVRSMTDLVLRLRSAAAVTGG
jgi:methoxymalonate biosynthesis acyl carrier protein